MYSKNNHNVEDANHRPSGEANHPARYSPYATRPSKYSGKVSKQSQIPSKSSLFSPSPDFQITDEDYKQFETEVKKKYGVVSDAGGSEKQLNREKKRLLSEMRLPLNNCGSKYIYIGLDPFDDFAPSVRILKSGVDDGAHFTAVTFREFMEDIPEVIIYLKDRTLHNFGLTDYKLVPATSVVFWNQL